MASTNAGSSAELSDQVLGSARYVAANVVPDKRMKPAGAGTQFNRGASRIFYSPDAIAPLQDSGGFNCVVELAASTCRRQAAASLHPVALLRTLPDNALSNLLRAAAPGGALAQVASMVAQLSPADYRAFALNLALHTLSFPDAGTVALGFQVTASFMAPGVSLEELQPPPIQLQLDNPAPGPLIAPLRLQRISDSAQSTFETPRMRQLPVAVSMSSSAISRRSPVQVVERTGAGSRFTSVPDNLRAFAIGSFAAELRAPLIHHDERLCCHSRVFADLRRATWTESPPPPAATSVASSDLRLVYDQCFTGWVAQATSLLQAPLDLPLTPTLSLVGQNPGGAPVPEVTDFEVQAFAIQSPAGFEPALVVAFDIMPGCHGIIEDVRHFIGPNSYGVISDEVVVGTIFHHKWNLGGFDRRLNLRSTVQANVVRNGQQQLEDAIVYGHADLLTLDSVSLTTDSNTRGDCLRFGGASQVTASTVHMVAGGESFPAADVGLGTPATVAWGVRGEISLQPSLDPDPEIRDFQIAASRDGIRHVARPFAFFPSLEWQLDLTYIRAYGVSKHVLVLGTLSVTLD